MHIFCEGIICFCGWKVTFWSTNIKLDSTHLLHEQANIMCTNIEMFNPSDVQKFKNPHEWWGGQNCI